MQKKKHMLSNYLSILLICILCFWSFFSGVNIRGYVYYTLCFTIEFLLFILYHGRIIIRKLFYFWLATVLLMLLYSDIKNPIVITFNATFAILVLMTIILSSNSQTQNTNLIIRILVAFSLVSVIFVILEYLLGTKMNSIVSVFLSGNRLYSELYAISNRSKYSGLASYNNVLTFSALILLCYAFYIIPNKLIIKKGLLLFLSVFIMLIGGERSNVIFLPLSFVITYLFQKKDGRINRTLKVVFIILVVCAIILVLLPVLSQFRMFARVTETLNSYTNGDDISNSRSVLFSRAISLWKQSPIIGNGWFYFYSNNIGIVRSNGYSHVHNLLLELLCDTGVVGLCLIFLPMVYILIINIKKIKEASDDRLIIYKFTFTIQLFFILDSMLHVTFYSGTITIMYFIVIALFLICYNNDNKLKRGN